MSTVRSFELLMYYFRRFRRTFCALCKDDDDDDHATEENEVPAAGSPVRRASRSRKLRVYIIIVRFTVLRAVITRRRKSSEKVASPVVCLQINIFYYKTYNCERQEFFGLSARSSILCFASVRVHNSCIDQTQGVGWLGLLFHSMHV